MHIKEKTCPLGTIRYRSPSIPEVVMLSGRMGLSHRLDRLKSMLEESELVWLSRIMENMGCLIVGVHLEKDGQKIETYEQALHQRECYEAIRDIAGEVFQDIVDANGWGKKKPPETTKTAPKKKKKSRQKTSRA